MKKLLSFLLIASVLFYACDDEVDEFPVKDPVPASITSPSSGFTKVITAENLTEAIKIEWTAADYGTSSTITYEVQIDSAGGDFSNDAGLGSVTTTSLTVTLENLNDALVDDLDLSAGEASSVDLRVVATVEGGNETVSNKVTITLTPFEEEDVEPAAEGVLWIPGEYQGWDAESAPFIRLKNDTIFEGFVYIGGATDFQFTSAPDFDHKVYGASEDAGKLTVGKDTDPLNISGAGYYRFRVDTTNLTYSAYNVESFGIIGDATAGAWNNSTPMEYDETTELWSIETLLGAGSLKFRANNSWDVNYGPEDPMMLTGNLIETQASITITEAGIYEVTIDFTRSEEPYEYTYTVVKTGDAPAVNTLWVPGDYQEWSPGTAPVIYSTSETTYEGYMYFSEGTGFKFTSAPDWEHTNYGFATDSTLTTDPQAGNLGVSSAGYYRFKVDVANLTYSIYKVESFGLIGDATIGGWNSSTAMTYDETTGQWSATADLVNGALKFRANDVWDVNYGPENSDSFEGTLIETQAAISIPEDGNYTIVIDMSRSNDAHEYTYRVTKN